MSRNKRRKIKKNISVYGSIEGIKTEAIFFKHLLEIYNPLKNHIRVMAVSTSGGSPDTVVNKAFRECSRDRAFAWFDEDFEFRTPLTSECKKRLSSTAHWNIKDELKSDFFKCRLKDLQRKYNKGNRNPVLIISNPVCVEGLILKTLGQSLPVNEMIKGSEDVQIKKLKEKLKRLTKDTGEKEFYKKNLKKEALEKKRKDIPELDLLISMITKQSIKQ